MWKYYCIKQKELKDCGCACLATICKQYGSKVPIYKIREIAKTDKMGTSVMGIMEASKVLGFSPKAFKAEKPDQIYGDIPLPAIAHVVFNKSFQHYVVIHKITKKYILIADPAKGIIKYKPKEFFAIWTGVILTFTKVANFSDVREGSGLFKKFFELIKPQKGLLINIFLSSILITIFGIVGSFYFKFLLNTVIPNDLKSTLTMFSIGLIILTLFSVLTSAFRRQLLIHFSQKLDIPLMLGYYDHIINLPMDFFHTRTVGEVISRLDDAYKIRSAISGATLTVMIDGFMAIIGGITLYVESSFLFYITLVPLVLYIIIVFAFKKIISTNNRETMQSQAELTSYLVQCLNGVETIKSFNGETQIGENIEKNFVKFMKDVFSLGTVNNIQGTLKGGVKAIFGIVILWIGTMQVLNGNITIGTLLTFNALLAYFLNPIENIVNFQSTLQSAIVAAQRLEEIIFTAIEKTEDQYKKIAPKDLKGDIRFKNVDFRYGNRKLILKDINIVAKKNTRIALVGESGSGKTTLSKLLMNFYPIDKGEILINGLNIKDINLECLRDRISYISQETFLFNKTIYENLTLGSSFVPYEEVIEACKKAQIHDYINSLPLRYDTLVEENGANFSGGQKQRLSIARAILKNPDILVMDEATSNLDSITEKAISDTMDEFMKDKTAIIIAHRLSTIKNCDRIYVLENGEVIEEGTHEELLNRESYYRKLWKDQMPSIEEPMKVGEE
ncbi:peptidase domain-containing ABC transporter [Clostridium thermobutyricum]|uniref:peptidase domain-containing ABC transporter n=1 Tax=Clostridium thermobutyricum TaxID=29372 RepID=UPI0018AA638B|nr:peptidase domain-containing ABC transporter [Clostridium thermobutyricum]